jgi:hypothetical protein
LRGIATPARNGSGPARFVEVFKGGLDLAPAEELLKRLPTHLQREAAVDLQRRWQPVLTEWLQQWDADDGELEPEEALSDEELEVDESPAKRQCRGSSQVVERPRPSDGYPHSAWPAGAVQGKVGFNAAAQEFLRNGGMDWRPPSHGDEELLKQQLVVAGLMHARSPVQRLLADHNTGSGKTLVMIRVLDNFYDDPRPKIAIFPKDVVVDNFYLGLLEWPSRWRDYICLRDNNLACIAANSTNWRSVKQKRWQLDLRNARIESRTWEFGGNLQKTLKEVFVKHAREILEMKRAFLNGRIRATFVEQFWAETGEDNTIHPPAGPLRAYRFTSAGGSAAEKDANSGYPRGCVFKIGFDETTCEYNPYSGKIVVMDEAHHLTRPQRMYQEQLGNLRSYLGRASNLTLLACTGSMVEDNVADPKSLLDAIKGDVFKHHSDEGFLSSHHRRGASFPHQVPTQCADGVLLVEQHLVEDVALTGTSLVRYVYQAMKLKREGAGDIRTTLTNFTNIYVYFGSVSNPACKRAISVHTETHAPKFAAVVRYVCAMHRKKEKCVVLCSRRTGYKALFNLLEEAGDANNFSLAELSMRADFNSKQNNRGQRYHCLVADADAGSESIEFKCVRHHILVDIPERHSDYIQRCGRSVRAHSHADVPEAERQVKFKFFRGVLPEFACSKIGAFLLWALCGYWGGPKKVVYNSEPDPSSIVEAAEALHDAFRMNGLGSLDSVRRSCIAHRIVEDEDLEPKLQKRVLSALEAIKIPSAWAAANELPLDTIDQRHLFNLRRAADRLAPAASILRATAIDAGMY